MKQLLIEEMKRAIELMEKNEKLERYREVEQYNCWTETNFLFKVHNRDISELTSLLKAIRKHSVILEKGIE